METTMSKKGTSRALLIGLLLIAVATALHGNDKKSIGAASIADGGPPPGNASALSIEQAKVRLEDGLKKRYAGKMKARFSFAVSSTYETSEATDIHVRNSGFEFAAPYSYSGVRRAGKVLVNFKKKGFTKAEGRCEVGVEDYLQVYRPDLGKTTSHVEGNLGRGHDKVVYPTPFYSVAYLPDPENAFGFFQCEPNDYAIFAWTDESAAQEFADAFNRLLWAAYQNEMDPEFVAAAKAWREKPVKPPLSEETERERILAENAIKEQELDAAVKHFESALEFQPTWPAGWFNLALIHAEQKDYAGATQCMKHYLELVPDAPDAKDARSQMVIWEDKAKR